MGTVLAVVFGGMIICLFFQFARQEYLEAYYEEIVLDVESRLEWARALNKFPFGMRSQLEVCQERLGHAKRLWGDNRWYLAYETACESQEAMDSAQDLYTSHYRYTQKS